MLRLASSSPPLWRTPSSVQLGADDPRPLEAVSPWQERLLDALVTGIPDARLRPLARELGATDTDADEFLARIARALEPSPAPAPAVRVEVPHDMARDQVEALLSALASAGVRVSEVAPWALPPGREPILLVASRLVDPHRAARLMADDVPHLAVELAGDRSTVGPFVRPGRSACLSCLHSHRRDADPQWPLVAAQLLGRSCTQTDPLVLVESAVVAAHLLRSGETDRSVVISAGDARREWRAHRPHPRCLCRSPEGTSTADAPGAPTPEPRTATGFARPA